MIDNSNILDLQSGLEAKEEGIAAVLAASEAVWSLEKAIEDLCQYLVVHGPCATEEWRAAYIKKDLPLPKHHNAWGAVVRTASKRNRIRWTGLVRPAESVKTHAHYVRVWKAAGIEETRCQG